MKCTLCILAAILLPPAGLTQAASPDRMLYAGLCLPDSTRVTKCVGGKIAECTRSRSVKCKTREKCIQSQQRCDLPALIR